MSALRSHRKFNLVWNSDASAELLYDDQTTPYPRSGHRVVVTDSNLYSIGGYNPDFWHRENTNEDTNYPLFKELWKFNLLRKKWTKMKTKGNMPKELASHAALLHQNNIIVYGGTGIPFGEAASNKVHVLNLKTLVWKELPTTGEPPLAGYGNGVVIMGRSLYVFAGTTGWTYNSDVFKLDLDTLEWEPQNVTGKPPEGRYRHECICDDKQLYVFGGGRAMEVFALDHLPAYEFETCNWNMLPCRPDPVHGYPLPRRCHSCVKLQNDVYLCGGYNGEQIYGDIWRINLKSLIWIKLKTKLPLPAYFHSAAITPVSADFTVYNPILSTYTFVNQLFRLSSLRKHISRAATTPINGQSGWMYVHGGVTTLDIERTSAVRSILLGLPSLRELSWLVVVTKISHQDTLPPVHHLLELGIPQDLLARLS